MACCAYCTAAGKARQLGDHGCLEVARSVPQDPHGPVAVDGSGRMVFDVDWGDNALAVPGGAVFVYVGSDREPSRGGQRARDEGA